MWKWIPDTLMSEHTNARAKMLIISMALHFRIISHIQTVFEKSYHI